jgi:hypothetical protein
MMLILKPLFNFVMETIPKVNLKMNNCFIIQVHLPFVVNL